MRFRNGPRIAHSSVGGEANNTPITSPNPPPHPHHHGGAPARADGVRNSRFPPALVAIVAIERAPGRPIFAFSISRRSPANPCVDRKYAPMANPAGRILGDTGAGSHATLDLIRSQRCQPFGRVARWLPGVRIYMPSSEMAPSRRIPNRFAMRDVSLRTGVILRTEVSRRGRTDLARWIDTNFCSF